LQQSQLVSDLQQRFSGAEEFCFEVGSQIPKSEASCQKLILKAFCLQHVHFRVLV